MRLTKATILAIRGLGTDGKQRIADALGKDIKTLYRYLAANDDNLTKAAALKAIKEETGLTEEAMLEDMGTAVDSLAKVNG